ncbi:GD19302 [Drosophila simulans]|uniref:GD19302 n=1 Tax=Drosophila simulans TaxID=7240 RepID=B4NW05_DROSI|nr:GD19302 [Drosophila simulans]
MPDTKWNQFSVLQIKKWLEALGRQTSGTKAELIVRLQAISPETRGDSPPNNGSAAEEVEELDGAAAWPKQREPQGGDTRTIPFDEQSLQSESPENLDLDQLSLVDAERATLKKLRDEIEANMAVLQRIQADIDEANKSKSAHARQINVVIKNNSNGNHGNVNICANSTDANVNSTDANVNSTKVTIAADNIDTGHTSVGNETAGSDVQHQSRNVNKLLEYGATSLAWQKR